MLDEHLETNEIKNIISERYPTLASYAVDELANIIRVKAETQEINQNGYKELIFSSSEVCSIIEVIALNDAELAGQIEHDLTTKNF
jgi:hypothetical protein